MRDKIVVVAGPTAVGKTKYAISISKEFSGEIISCDSMQIYEGMNIGSAKPTEDERRATPHHLIDFIDPKEDFTVVNYQELARRKIKEVSERNKLPIICGGTGLYLNSILYEMDFGIGEKDEEYRNSLFEYAEEMGPEALHKRLKEVDKDSANRIHPNNIKRVVRALEAAEIENKPIGDFSGVGTKNPDVDPVLIALTRDRENLYKRIDRRVDIMMENGLISEVTSLMKRGLTEDDISMKGIGYKEIIAFLNDEYDQEEAIRLIKRNSRRYAKRQLTWFKRYDDMKWFNIDEYDSDEKVLEDIFKCLRKS